MKKLLVLATFSVISFVAILGTFPASAQTDHFSLQEQCTKLKAAAPPSKQDDVDKSSVCVAAKNAHDNPSDSPIYGPNGIINKVANTVAIVAGSIAVIIIVVSGIAMITSNGDAQAFAKARSGIIYAVVGLVIIGLAKAIVSFAVNHIFA